MPLDAPVTTATRPVSFAMCDLLSLVLPPAACRDSQFDIFTTVYVMGERGGGIQAFELLSGTRRRISDKYSRHTRRSNR
jgi:hypothetical protein